ncbi:SRPR [Enterospora canceri]|uniref:Signal recognition particle receptor subunit alpha homolog n=1 Tax=Enterospora canceri TaxID=1081671 RepID=A0A1Y1S8J1_9MICR|nr:SRPR [Enterospora canceri]
MDRTKMSEKKRVRDMVAEWRIEGDLIYLAIGAKEGVLDTKVEEFKRNRDESAVKNDQGKIGRFTRKTLQLFTGKIELGELRTKMVEHLVDKNVTPKYAEQLADGITEQFRLSGRDWATEAELKEQTRKALQRILVKIDTVDLVAKIRNSTRPFVFCFVGVNGVGKSTSLAKMTKWLLDQRLTVFIAACDTFRAGAVEQLRVHVDRFTGAGRKVGFYESGYNKDDATVAKNAIAKGAEQNYDAVLIDTAGRMHENKVLMSSLSRIVRVNKPDHIVYVGEALTGNDSLDFISEFNRSISKAIPKREIDSIILTKVDTVDEKIGQIFNLMLASSAPILFLGVGQANSDLLEMDSEQITELIL